MDYIEVFESNHREEFYSALNFLISKGVSVQTLFEYRFDGDTDFISGSGPVFIRVLAEDVPIAEKWIEQWRKIQEGAEPFTSSFLNRSELDSDLSKHWVNQLVGKKIISVEYSLPNKMKVDYGPIHWTDAGVLVFLDTGDVFCFYFKEGETDFELEFETPTHCAVELMTKRPRFIWGKYEKKMNRHALWKGLLKSVITNVECYSQEVQGNSYVTDLTVTTDQGKFHLCMSDEPSEKHSANDFELEIEADGSLVLFTEELIQKRLKF